MGFGFPFGPACAATGALGYLASHPRSVACLQIIQPPDSHERRVHHSQQKGPHSIWKTQPEAIPCKFWLHSAHVAQHPQVILGRALGHQCRHPPRLNHEQLLRQAQARHPPMVGRPDFGRVAGPLPSSVVDDTVPGTNTISCWGSRSPELPLHSWFFRSVSPDFVCGHHHRTWW